MILILGTATDLRSGTLAAELLIQNLPFVMLDTQDYPGNVRISQSLNVLESILEVDGHGFEAGHIQSVYYCLNNHFGVSGEENPELRNIVYQNIDAAFWSFFHALERERLFVNPILPANQHQYKTDALSHLSAHGIRVPDTLVTNTAEDVIRFFERYKRGVVAKPPWGQAFTEKLTKDHLKKDRLAQLVRCPVMLQELVEGQDHRAYVIGNEIYGIAIESSTLDLNQDANAQRHAVLLPDSVVSECLAIAKLTGLVFTAIDFRLTPQGEAVYFEANSSPDFTIDLHWTDYPLCESLIRLLASGKA